MADNEVRRELLLQWMQQSADSPYNFLGFAICEVGWDRRCTGRAQDGHEIILRSRGGSPIDRKNVLLTCRYCHEQIHRNPEEATQRGFMASNTKEQPSAD